MKKSGTSVVFSFLATLFVPALLYSSSLFAEPKVLVKGLFANRAILEINGEDRLLRAGEETDDGIVLVSSNSRVAVVRIDGVEKTLSLSQEIASDFTEAKEKMVRIPMAEDSHYRVGGSINGVPVQMMVDTGATAVAMNTKEAERLGINYTKGQPIQSSTAGGMVESYMVELNKISVGGISVYNIKAVVIPGDYPEQILLGNTFLHHVTLQQEAGALVLKSKY